MKFFFQFTTALHTFVLYSIFFFSATQFLGTFLKSSIVQFITITKLRPISLASTETAEVF